MKHYAKAGGLLIFKDETVEKKVYWHLYDCDGKSILTFFDYLAHHVGDKKVGVSKIEDEAYTLKMWFEFLDNQGVDQFSAGDSHIELFRTSLLARKSANVKGNAQARMRTVNGNLKVVYQFYRWLQKHHRYGVRRFLLGTDGSGCNITSNLAELGEGDMPNSKSYPKLLTGTGVGSKHKINYIPTDVDRADTVDYLNARHGPGVAHRNVLLQDIAEETGLRRASVCSLLAPQFTLAELEKCERAARPYLVLPSDQKRGYDNLFAFPHDLVVRIINYISTDRAEIIRRTGSKSDCLFLNVKYGTPLKLGSVTTIFTRASRALDQPHDSGMHGSRRRYANKKDNELFQASLEVGGDTSAETLGRMLASALGQSSTASQSAYLRNQQLRFKKTATIKQSEENTRLKNENAMLRSELNQLKQVKDK
ncbi:hypothetical protein [Herbaspirillum sp. CAH-3]|uniref:hypothetical protein n=1 Tax=Herbaspirillum sp. CAH-3 TaxID=2605746 RepID=UPI0012AC7EB4|nr:hypothetical protein [Herbaspirillum sp. CAH-3]MRT30410.1 hypothetical protein [Herbaspirillum sp. CAH-3]